MFQQVLLVRQYPICQSIRQKHLDSLWRSVILFQPEKVILSQDGILSQMVLEQSMILEVIMQQIRMVEP